MTQPGSGNHVPPIAAENSGVESALLRLLDKPVSAADLAAGARDAAMPADTRARGNAGVLLFRLDEETFGISAKSLRRITTHTNPTPIPHRTSGVLRGICNIRGELILCTDLRRLLGLPKGDTAGTLDPGSADARRMVVIGPADAPWVFEVDSLIGVERIDTTALLPPPMTVEHALGACVAGLAEIDGVRITVLDADRVLSGFKAGMS